MNLQEKIKLLKRLKEERDLIEQELKLRMVWGWDFRRLKIG